MQIGDKVKLKDRFNLLEGCEGTIIKILDKYFLIELYKGNHRISEEEVNGYYVFFSEESLDKK